MELINNLTRNNHRQRLIKSFENADEITIISPFISKDFGFFPFEQLTRITKVTLITTLKPRTADQYSKVPFFKELFEFCNARSIQLQILIENSLHGKIYISKANGQSLEAIITSANFTKSGLSTNNEWGAVIKDGELIKRLEEGILTRVIFEPITESIVDVFISTLDKNPTKPTEEFAGANLTDTLGVRDVGFAEGAQKNYWLKPIGVTGHPIPWDTIYDEVENKLHFASRPTGVKLGDILITYAVGHSNVLCVYRVTSTYRSTGKKDDRWPYYVMGENLTPYYGQVWNEQDITITNQKKAVLAAGKFNMTPSGKNSFGSFMRGADKLRLTPEFGEHLSKKVLKIDERLRAVSSQ